MRIWDTVAGRCLWTFAGHSKSVARIVYSSQGDLVLSSSHEKSVRVWDVTSGQCQAVIQDFQAGVKDIGWIESSGVNYLVAGCADGVVGVWQVLIAEDRCDVFLKWKTLSGELELMDAIIQDAQGLTPLNRTLLKRRGAVGQPAHRLHGSGKKVTTMASVASKLKKTSENAAESPSYTNSTLIMELEQTIEQAAVSFEQRFQQTKDSLIQDVCCAASAMLQDSHLQRLAVSTLSPLRMSSDGKKFWMS